jgi:hypothetical protein
MTRRRPPQSAEQALEGYDLQALDALSRPPGAPPPTPRTPGPTPVDLGDFQVNLGAPASEAPVQDTPEEAPEPAAPREPVLNPSQQAPFRVRDYGGFTRAGGQPIDQSILRPSEPLTAEDMEPEEEDVELLPQAETPEPEPGPAAVRKSETKDASAPAPAQGIDANLPSEDDIRGAEAGDIVRRFFHGLGGGLVAAGGGRPQEFRSNADALRQRRQQGLTQQREWKRQDVAQQQVQEGRQYERAQEADDRAYNRGRDAVQDDRANRQLSLQEARMEQQAEMQRAQLALREAQSEPARQRAMQELMRLDPESSATQEARTRFITRVMSAPPAVRRLYGENEAEIGARLQGLSAYSIERLEGGIPRTSIKAMSNGLGGLGVSGSSPIMEGLREAAVEAGMDPRVVAGMSREDLTRSAEQARRAGVTVGQVRAQQTGEGGTPRGVQLLPGVYAGVDVSPTEERTFRQLMDRVSAGYGDLQEMQRLTQQYGRTARVTPSARSEMRANFYNLQTMAAALGEAGVIQQGDLERMRGVLPNDQDLEQSTFGTVEDSLRQWFTTLERGVRRRLANRGVSEEQIERAIRGIRTGRYEEATEAAQSAPAQPRQSQRRTIRVRLPDGTTGNIPESAWDEEEAREQGIERLD